MSTLKTLLLVLLLLCFTTTSSSSSTTTTTTTATATPATIATAIASKLGDSLFASNTPAELAHEAVIYNLHVAAHT